MKSKTTKLKIACFTSTKENNLNTASKPESTDSAADEAESVGLHTKEDQDAIHDKGRGKDQPQAQGDCGQPPAEDQWRMESSSSTQLAIQHFVNIYLYVDIVQC